jgi:hypothetical protein
MSLFECSKIILLKEVQMKNFFICVLLFPFLVIGCSKSNQDLEVEKKEARYTRYVEEFKPIIEELQKLDLRRTLKQKKVRLKNIDSRKVLFVQAQKGLRVSSLQAELDPYYQLRFFKEENRTKRLDAGYITKMFYDKIATKKDEVGITIMVTKKYDKVGTYDDGKAAFRTTIMVAALSYPENKLIGLYGKKFDPPKTKIGSSNASGPVPVGYYLSVLRSLYAGKK